MTLNEIKILMPDSFIREHLRVGSLNEIISLFQIDSSKDFYAQEVADYIAEKGRSQDLTWSQLLRLAKQRKIQ